MKVKMKQTKKVPGPLLALAGLALAGPALAQSSVTLFGVVDAAVSGNYNRSEDLQGPTLANPGYVNKGSVTASRTELRHSGTTTSRLGFRGTEDLGGGMAAGFWLEAALNNDDGSVGVAPNQMFSRRSTLSLSGVFGEIRLGRDYTPTFWNDSLADPWQQIGAGSSLMLSSGSNSPGGPFAANANYARASNTVGYFLPPNLGGFYGQAMYGFHENTKYDPGSFTPPGLNAAGAVNPGAVAPTRAGRYLGGRFGYANGPLDVAVGYAEDTLGDNFFAGTTDKVSIANLFGAYDFGVVRLTAEVSRHKFQRDYALPTAAPVRDIQVNGYLVGLTAPVGPGLIRAAYSHVTYDIDAVVPTPDPSASKLALGYVHNLSKRTALYATVARVKNKNGAARTVGGPAFVTNSTFTPDTSTGYDLGMRVIF